MCVCVRTSACPLHLCACTCVCVFVCVRTSARELVWSVCVLRVGTARWRPIVLHRSKKDAAAFLAAERDSESEALDSDGEPDYSVPPGGAGPHAASAVPAGPALEALPLPDKEACF